MTSLSKLQAEPAPSLESPLLPPNLFPTSFSLTSTLLATFLKFNGLYREESSLFESEGSLGMLSSGTGILSLGSLELADISLVLSGGKVCIL